MALDLPAALAYLKDEELASVARALPDHLLARIFRLCTAVRSDPALAAPASEPSPSPEPESPRQNVEPSLPDPPHVDRAPLAVEERDGPGFAVVEPVVEEPQVPPGLPRSYRRVFAFLAKSPDPVASVAVADGLGMSFATARLALRQLKARGLAELHGATNNARWSLVRAPHPAPKTLPAAKPAGPALRPSVQRDTASPPAEVKGRIVALPVADMKEASDLFRCTPLSVTMMGRACVARQQGARAQAGKHPTCKACPLGEQVARAVKLDPSGADLIDGRVASGTSWARMKKKSA